MATRDDIIAKAFSDHFQQIFSGEEKIINENNLECIRMMISQDQNARLINISIMEEFKEVVF